MIYPTIKSIPCIFLRWVGIGSLTLLWLVFTPKIMGDDWPVYRGDKRASAVSNEHLTPPFSLKWVYNTKHPPKPAWPASYSHVDRRRQNRVYNLTVSEGLLYFSSPTDDTVYALGTDSASIQWQFTADAPVRFAPTIWENKVYVSSDDGKVYCLDAQNGSVIWQHLAGPKKDRLIGNGRMISRWPVRTNVLVDDGIAYFASGIFPYEGTYIWALNAETGSLVWRHDMRENLSKYQNPEGVNFSSLQIGGRAPHGYLVANESTLFVPTGRGMPMAYDRKTGQFKFETGEVRYGGTWMMLVENRLFAGISDSRARNRKWVYDVNTGRQIGTREQIKDEFAYFSGYDAIATKNAGFSMTRDGIVAIDRAFYKKHSHQIQSLSKRIDELWQEFRNSNDNDSKKQIRQRINKLEKQRGDLQPNKLKKWSIQQRNLHTIMLAGNVLFAGGDNMVLGVNAETGERIWQAPVSSPVYSLVAADGKLFASTEKGCIYCFEPGKDGKAQIVRQELVDNYIIKPTEHPVQLHKSKAEFILEHSQIEKGWGIILGADDNARLAYELCNETELDFIVLEKDPEKLKHARKKLQQAGLYGARIVVESWDIDTLPDYFANLIVFEKDVSQYLSNDEFEISRLLRPYGGVAFIEQNSAVNKNFGSVSDYDTKVIEGKRKRWVKVVRKSLNGAAEWTHLYGDQHNTGISDDDLVKGPLEVLWFGNPSEREMIDRHGRGMGPLAADGLMFVQGEGVLQAYDSYNGTMIWERSIDGAYRARVDVDGGNLALNNKGLFLAANDQCYRLDPQTGVTLDIYQTPSDKPNRWGYIAVVDDMLIGTTSTPHRFPHAVLWDAWVDEEQDRWREDWEVPKNIREGEFAEHRWWRGGNKDNNLPKPIPTQRFKDVINWYKQTYPQPTEEARSAMHKSFKLYEPITFYPPWDPLKSLDFQAVSPQLSSVSSDSVFAIDIESGKNLWTHKGEMIPNIAITAGNNKLFFLDNCRTEKEKQEGILNRKEYISQRVYKEDAESNVPPDMKDIRQIIAIGLQTGDTVWEKCLDITGCGGDRTSLLWSNGVLVIAGNFNLKDLVGWYHNNGLSWRRVITLDSNNGKMLWSEAMNYSHRPSIINDNLLVEPHIVNLRKNEILRRKHPITGKQVPFMIDRVGKNCAPIQGGKHVLFFRNRDIQFFDYENDIGITRIGSIRPSCWINMIAANGLALIPVGDSGCSCPYPLRTSFAMKHKKDNSFVPWSYYTRTDDSLRPAEHFAINLGAPGDHRDKNGTLWFGYPRPTGTESPRNMIDFELNERVAESMGSFAQDHRFKQIANTKRPWLFASGILGLYSLEIPLSDGQDSEYSVQLGFAALNGDKPGQRVFDIKLQGKLVAENFNISTNGFEDNVTALVKKFNNIKVEKNLVLEFVPKNQNLNMRTAPLLNFIKVSRSN